MAFASTVLKVLIASPSDLAEEREASEVAIHEWNASNAEAERVVLLPVRWETNTFPTAGVRPQAAVNRQIVDGSDILLALFWTRLGTHTGVAASGTVEEVERFTEAGKPVLIYFSERAMSPADIDVEQLRRLRDFQSSTYERALVATFQSPLELKHTLFKHLTAVVRQIQVQRSGTSGGQLAEQIEASETQEPDDYYKASPAWEMWDYMRAYLMATSAGRDDLASGVNADFCSSSLATEDAKAEWQAWIEFSRLEAGKDGDVTRISRLSESHPTNPRIKLTLASALARYDNGAAARTLREAAALAKDPEDVYQAVRRALALEAQDQRTSETDSLLELLIRFPVPEGSKQVPAMEALRAVAKARGLNSIALAVAERVSALAPHDTDLRFQLAHELGDSGYTALAKLHYEAIPISERSGAAWNNLGVALQTLGMPGAAIAAYDRAAALEETVADSNVANMLREAGFFQQAQERLVGALDPQDHDENVIAALEAIRAAREEEQKQDRISRIAARAEHDFMEIVGQSGLVQRPVDLTGKWDIGDCILDMRLDGSGGLVGVGTLRREVSGIAAALTGPGYSPPTIVDVRIELGRLGNALQGKISRMERDSVPSFLGGLFQDKAILAYAADDGSVLHVWQSGSELPAVIWRRVAMAIELGK